MMDYLIMSPRAKLERIARLLEAMYQTSINFDDIDALSSLYEEALSDQRIIKETVLYNTYHQSPKYMRACLIQEAVKIFLTELHPRRSRKDQYEKGDSK